MAWDNAVVTNNGIALLSQVLSGGVLTLDAAAGGTGTVSPAALMAQTALKSQKQQLPIIGATNVPNGKKINVQITNRGLAGEYNMQQLGIWAHVGAGASVLFAILQDDTGVKIPSESDVPDFALNFYAVIDFSNEAEFQLVIDPSVLVTVGSMNAAISAAVAPLQTKITVSGLLKGDGAGNITAAQPGVDYGYPLKNGATDPTPSTVGTVGQHYFNTATGQEFVCIAASGGVYTWKPAGANDAADITYDNQPLDEALTGIKNNLTTHTADKANPHAVTAAQAGAVPTSRTINNKALTGNIALTAADVNADPSGSAAAALTAANAAQTAATAANNNANSREPAISPGTAAHYWRGDKTWQNFDAAVQAAAPMPTFVYKCTGINDDLAIQNLVNNFFTSGTAMSMKLIISGTMGLQAAPANSRQINISATNVRGAVCFLDFSDCSIPTITTSTRHFFCISSASVNLVVTGLVVKTTAWAIVLNNASNNIFADCKLINTDNSHLTIQIDAGSSANSFHNCIIISEQRVAISLSSANDTVFTNCDLTGYVFGASIGNAPKTSVFSNCRITCNNGPACNIDANANGIISFIACKIVGSTIGLNCATANTAAEIKLIGCAIKGTTTQDVNQTTATNTVKWHIEGCSFSRANIIADGTTAITQKTGASIYMPQYANQFSSTIT